MYSLNWQINWLIIRKTSLVTSFIYYHGSELQTRGEIFDQYGPQVTLGHPLTTKLTGSLGYQFYWRDSNEAGRDYRVNIVSLNFTYTF